MFQVIICDHMRDYLSQEILVEYGPTEEVACENAWDILKAELKSVIKEFYYDEKKVTRKLFIEALINSLDSEDAVFLEGPMCLYVKLIKLPTCSFN